MKSRHAIVALVAVNLALLVFQVAHGRPSPTGDAPVRARSFELVDDQGRVRAELKVYPAQPNVKMPDGTTGFPEEVQLRLISSKGGPNVKLAAIEDGAGLSMANENGYVQILSRTKDDPFVKIVTKDGRQQVLKP
jgi:hypothetical protein